MDSLGYDDVFLRLGAAVLAGATHRLRSRDPQQTGRASNDGARRARLCVLRVDRARQRDLPIPPLASFKVSSPASDFWVPAPSSAARRKNPSAALPRQRRSGSPRPSASRAALRSGRSCIGTRLLGVFVLVLEPIDRLVKARMIVSSKPSHDLDIDEDLSFQKKEWRAQRIGIALLFILRGRCRAGPHRHGRTAERGRGGPTNGPVFVEFERFVRRNAMSTIRAHLHTSPGTCQLLDVRAVLQSRSHREHGPAARRSCRSS